jgi:hypothetical protein
MKKLMILCAVILGFAFTASAQDDKKAEFKFVEETHSFGKIPAGKPVTTEFVFTNVGQEPLILTEVRPACGCTVADYTKTPVKKGEKGWIKVTFNTPATAQAFTKQINITSNARTPLKTLVISGEVVVGNTAAASK